MKKLILSLLLSICMISVNAQSIINNPNNRSYLGVRASLDITNLDVPNVMDFSPSAGFSVGAIYHVPVFMNLYVEPGLSLYYNTYSTDGTFLGISDNTYYNIDMDCSVRHFGLKIPVNVGFHVDFAALKVSVFTGPALRIGFTGKEYYKYKVDNHTVKYDDDLYDQEVLNRVDFAWAVGAGLTFRSYYFGISGDFGLTNQWKDVDNKMNTCHITLGYNF